ncbi:MAG: glycosyltransferase family 39 protein [Candidatus Omnitrophica bacterium]|nr:glycosyltransferase family 39 protein [Candidatus Omnitrophota bacterium]
MNILQIALFFVYFFSVLIAGIAVYRFLNKENSDFINRAVYVGESFLLGSICLIGAMLFLSSLGLYVKSVLWGVVISSYFLLFSNKIRQDVYNNVIKGFKPAGCSLVFLIIIAFFFFRNCYFLLDVDSHSMYLFAQKLWLSHKSSFIGNAGHDARIFVPHFNAVPYSLGIALFPKETLFPQLINFSWSFIALLLLYGYARFRLSAVHALAAVLFVLLNRHFLYSGMNTCCVINSAIICFLFAIAYCFWEARERQSPFRFFIAIIFLVQLMGNKYQMVYISIAFLILGALIQRKLDIKKIFCCKRLLFLFFCVFTACFWYLRNYIVTGDPVFPILAGKFNSLNWAEGMSRHAMAIWGGNLDLPKILKFFNYLCVWPGIIPLKYVAVGTIVFPLAILVLTLKNNLNNRLAAEVSYWLFMSVVYVIALCMAMFVDPRHYGYGAAIFSFATVLFIDFILKTIFNLNKKVIMLLLIIVSLLPHGLIYESEGQYRLPSFKDNLGVILNKVHLRDVLARDFKKVIIASEGFEANKEIALESAWYAKPGGIFYSMFLLPERPIIGLWVSSIVKWESYTDKDKIVKDINDFGIKSLMKIEGNKLIFISPEEYAEEAMTYDLYPKSTRYDYGFPAELSSVE